MSSRVIIISAFVLLSLASWYFLPGFALREYVAAIPILFSLQILMNDFIELYLMAKLDAGWFRLFIAPGTILHELSHAAAAKIIGCKVTSVSLLSLDPKKSTLGAVEYEQPQDSFAVIRSFVVGFAPFFGCGIVLIALLNLTASYYSSSVLTPAAIDAGSIESILDSIYLIGALFYQQFSYMTANPIIPALLYLQICVGLGAAASSVDMKGAFSSLAEHPLGTVTLLLFFAAAFYLSEQPMTSAYVLYFFGWVLFILLTSISLLIASIPLLFVGATFVEVSWIKKLASIAAAALVYVLTGSILLSLGAFLLLLSILRFSWVFFKSA